MFPVETFNFNGGGIGTYAVGNTITSGSKSGVITQVVDGTTGTISVNLSGLPFAVSDSITNGGKTATRCDHCLLLAAVCGRVTIPAYVSINSEFR